MAVMILCECAWGLPGVQKLPPHIHYRAGLAVMPGGEKKWIGGFLGQGDTDAEQRDFIQFEAKWDREQAEEAVAAMRPGREGSK